jgi:hypothetical protein
LAYERFSLILYCKHQIPMEVAMLRLVLSGTAALAIAGSTLVYAQYQDGPGVGYGQPQQPPGPGYGNNPQQPGAGPGMGPQAQQPGEGPDDDDQDHDGPDEQHAGDMPQQGPQLGYQQQPPGPGYGAYQQQAPGPQYGAYPQAPGPQYGAYPDQQQQQGQDYSLAALPSPEDINSFVEGRLAALRVGLKLTPEQTKNWAAFEQASRELAKLEADRAAQAREAQAQARPPAQQQAAAAPSQAPGAKPPAGAAPAQQAATPPSPPNIFEDLQRAADALTRDGTAFKKLADAGAPLYKSLDDEQKQRFLQLSQGLIPH